MEKGNKKWFYFILLSLVWGSSFILIKKALIGFTPLQLGALRILFAASFLLIVGYKSLKEIKKQDWKWVLAAGFLSSFIPPFLFALAQTEIDSGITSIFNSLTPLNTTNSWGFIVRGPNFEETNFWDFYWIIRYCGTYSRRG